MRLLSWNIQWGRGCDGRVDLDRIAAVIHAQGEIDVVCLQEVAVNHPGLPGSRGEDQVAELARRFPGHRPCYSAASDLLGDNGERRLFGNLILSRLPLLQVLRHPLPAPADADIATMPRVALEAIVDSPAGPLRIITTHLEYYSLRQRRAQMQALAGLQRSDGFAYAGRCSDSRDADAPYRCPPRPQAAVCCGDFNCAPEAPELQELLALGDAAGPFWHDAWPLLHPGAPHAHSVGLHGAPWPDHPYCCDYFLVSQALRGRVRRIEVEQATDASDHQPVLLELG